MQGYYHTAAEPQKDTAMVNTQGQKMKVGCYPYFFGRARRTGLRLEAVGIRNRGILGLLAKRSDGDMMAATLDWDFNHAALTTNAAQLREIGMENPLGSAEHDRAEDAVSDMAQCEVTEALVRTIEALADLHIFLVNTDGFGDGELLLLLWTVILQEQVRDLPPGSAAEFIDLNTRRSASSPLADRDRFLPIPGGRE